MNAKPSHCRRVANLYTCSPEAPDANVIASAVAAIRSGKVVCYPTSGLYGLGADACNPAAIRRVFTLKKRAPDRPILVLIDAPARLDQLVVRVPALARELMERFWPGQLTLVFEAQRSVPAELTAGTGKIGVRLPAHPVAMAILSELKAPLTGTSANVSGEPGCGSIGEIPDTICSRVAMVIDSGRLSGGRGSTVVDISRDRPRILREGAVASAAILKG